MYEEFPISIKHTILRVNTKTAIILIAVKIYNVNEYTTKINIAPKTIGD